MSVMRMDFPDTGSPEGLLSLILKHEPEFRVPVPIEELALQLEIEQIAELDTDGFEGDGRKRVAFILRSVGAGCGHGPEHSLPGSSVYRGS